MHSDSSVCGRTFARHDLPSRRLPSRRLPVQALPARDPGTRPSRTSRPTPRRSRQGGLTLLGLLTLAIVGGLGALLVMKVVPSAVEFMAIKKAVVRAANSSSDGNPAEIRAAFERSAAVEDFSSISGKDLIVTKQNGRAVVTFAYEKRIPLVGPASLVIDYRGDSQAAQAQ